MYLSPAWLDNFSAVTAADYVRLSKAIGLPNEKQPIIRDFYGPRNADRSARGTGVPILFPAPEDWVVMRD